MKTIRAFIKVLGRGALVILWLILFPFVFLFDKVFGDWEK